MLVLVSCRQSPARWRPLWTRLRPQCGSVPSESCTCWASAAAPPPRRPGQLRHGTAPARLRPTCWEAWKTRPPPVSSPPPPRAAATCWVRRARLVMPAPRALGGSTPLFPAMAFPLYHEGITGCALLEKGVPVQETSWTPLPERLQRTACSPASRCPPRLCLRLRSRRPLWTCSVAWTTPPVPRYRQWRTSLVGFQWGRHSPQQPRQASARCRT